MNSPRRFLRQTAEHFANFDPIDLVLLLTVVILLVRPGPMEPWYVLAPTSIIAILIVLDRSLLRQPTAWFLLAGISFVGNNFMNWEFSDNHKFLTTYWLLAIAASLSLPDPRRWLASNGRTLIGLVFLFATVWKLTSDAYLDHSMFRLLLISDPRFFGLSHYLGGLEPAQFAQNGTVLTEYVYQAKQLFVPNRIPLVESAGIGAFAAFLTWWTILIEGLIAVLFLIPKENTFTRWRHAVLIAFAVTTYPPTNVIHFGWLIMVMGLAACPIESKRTRLAYVVSFLFIFIFSTGQIREWLYQSLLRSG